MDEGTLLARILAKGKSLFALDDIQELKTEKGVQNLSLDSSPRSSKGVECSSGFLHDLSESGSHLNELSSKLTRHLFYTKSKDNNLVFSPLSIHIVLSLVAAGFEDPIRAPILSFFKSDSVEALTELLSPFLTKVLADASSSGGPHLASANGVWVDQSLPLEQAFQDVVQDVYKACLSQVDFPNKYEEVRREVNSWVEEKTRSLIKEILPPGCVNSETTHTFVNAMYFKGAWWEKFDASKTKNYKFYLLNGKSVRTPFMTSSERQCISDYNGFKVLELGYRKGDCREDGRRFSMCIFLPDAKNGLSMLVDKLVSESKFIENHTANETVEVGKFLIPKFKMSFDFEASKLMKELGLDLPSSMILHKSFIEVNEEGTEAAAATAFTVVVGCSMVPRVYKKLDFVADHPFLFLIKENNSGVVLFTGLVLDPSTS